MNYSKLKEVWKKEEEAIFKGWDFSYLENRWDDEELPWNYEEILKKYLRSDYKLFILIITHLLQKCGYLMLNYANKN